MSLRRFAAWAGLSHTAVQQRIAAGALPTSAQKINGLWMILDAEVALAEWRAHTRPWVAAGGEDGDGAGEPGPASPLALATQRERLARAESLELELARKRRELVPAWEVEMRWTSLVIEVKNQLLGVPSRLKQRCPAIRAGDLVELEAVLREALDRLADGAGDPAGQDALKRRLADGAGDTAGQEVSVTDEQAQLAAVLARLEAVPARVRERLSHLAAEDLAAIDDVVRAVHAELQALAGARSAVAENHTPDRRIT
jgi:phage terminase Nu1 subunit (DNA packaging protein)